MYCYSKLKKNKYFIFFLYFGNLILLLIFLSRIFRYYFYILLDKLNFDQTFIFFVGRLTLKKTFVGVVGGVFCWHKGNKTMKCIFVSVQHAKTITLLTTVRHHRRVGKTNGVRLVSFFYKFLSRGMKTTQK